MKSMLDMGVSMIERAERERAETGEDYPKAMIYGFPTAVRIVRNEEEEQEFHRVNLLSMKIAFCGLIAVLLGFVAAVIYFSFPH